MTTVEALHPLERSGQYNVIKVSALTLVSGGVSAVDGLLRFDNEETPLLDLKPLSAHSQDGTIGRTPPLPPEWPGPWACGVIKLSPD